MASTLVAAEPPYDDFEEAFLKSMQDYGQTIERTASVMRRAGSFAGRNG